MENFFPEILIQYLLPFRQAFSKPGFGYFQGFIAALLLSQGRKCISHIANTCFFIDKSLSSWERFLASAQWDLPQVTQHLIGFSSNNWDKPSCTLDVTWWRLIQRSPKKSKGGCKAFNAGQKTPKIPSARLRLSGITGESPGSCTESDKGGNAGR